MVCDLSRNALVYIQLLKSCFEQSLTIIIIPTSWFSAKWRQRVTRKGRFRRHHCSFKQLCAMWHLRSRDLIYGNEQAERWLNSIEQYTEISPTGIPPILVEPPPLLLMMMLQFTFYSYSVFGWFGQ